MKDSFENDNDWDEVDKEGNNNIDEENLDDSDDNEKHSNNNSNKYLFNSNIANNFNNISLTDNNNNIKEYEIINEEDNDSNQIFKDQIDLDEEKIDTPTPEENIKASKIDIKLTNIDKIKNEEDLCELDIKEKKTDSLSLTTYYEIILINKIKNLNNIKSYRRYDNFSSLYEALKLEFPYYIFPKLSEKNIINKYKKDNDFMLRRKNQLKYFINYLFKHNEIKDSTLFKKFLNDSEFDEKYFKSIKYKYLSPYTDQYIANNNYSVKNGIKIIYNTIKGINSYEYKYEKTNNEKELIKIKKFYKDLFENFENIYNYFKKYCKYSKKNIKNLEENSRCFLKLKLDNNLNSESERDKFLDELILINKSIQNKKENINVQYINILDDFDKFLLYLNGVNESLDRYFDQFLKEYEKVLFINNKILNEKIIEKEKISEEASLIQNAKQKYEDNLINEIGNFMEENKDRYEKIIKNFINIINEENKNENIILNENKNIFED